MRASPKKLRRGPRRVSSRHFDAANCDADGDAMPGCGSTRGRRRRVDARPRKLSSPGTPSKRRQPRRTRARRGSRVRSPDQRGERSHAVRNDCHPLSARQRSADRRGHDAHLPDLHLRAARTRRPPRLRLLAHRESDAPRARGEPCAARRRRPRTRVRERARGGRSGAQSALRRRPRRGRTRPLRRRVPPLHEGLCAVRHRVHVRGRDRRGSDPHVAASGNQASLARDSVEPAALHHRHRRGVRGGEGARHHVARGQHVRHAVAPASARSRRRHRSALDDEVPERARRRDRRRARHAVEGSLRPSAVPAERRGRGAGSAGLLPRAARHQDAGPAHGAALRERARSGRVPRRTPEGRVGVLARPDDAPGAPGGEAADEGFRRGAVVRAEGRRGDREGVHEAHEAVRARREPWLRALAPLPSCATPTRSSRTGRSTSSWNSSEVSNPLVRSFCARSRRGATSSRRTRRFSPRMVPRSSAPRRDAACEWRSRRASAAACPCSGRSRRGSSPTGSTGSGAS